MSLNIDKNGRIFAVECIIFQDDSFEISINDITQEKEQALLKKQLTQNIAHELKTPVSSIQGYLETIVNNPTLPREKINAFLERSYAQSNRLAHLLRDISVLYPHGRSSEHDRDRTGKPHHHDAEYPERSNFGTGRKADHSPQHAA